MAEMSGTVESSVKQTVLFWGGAGTL